MKGPFERVHSERKHSKYSASGAERWFNCSGSVALSEGEKSKDTPQSTEGTKGHEVLELQAIGLMGGLIVEKQPGVPREMYLHALKAAQFMFNLHTKNPGSEFMVETRIFLPFIHPEMFGTFDGAVVDHFGTLHVFDYKYGKRAVSPVQNLQMIFYGLGLAAKFNWNFKRVRLWIIQPRITGYDGPRFWELNIPELRSYVDTFAEAVERVEKFPKSYAEGPWCYFCLGKKKCPLKKQERTEKAKAVFTAITN